MDRILNIGASMGRDKPWLSPASGIIAA
jgi:hypothetical protein